jgi:hypothetical protein
MVNLIHLPIAGVIDVDKTCDQLALASVGTIGEHAAFTPDEAPTVVAQYFIKLQRLVRLRSGHQ